MPWPSDAFTAPTSSNGPLTRGQKYFLDWWMYQHKPTCKTCQAGPIAIKDCPTAHANQQAMEPK